MIFKRVVPDEYYLFSSDGYALAASVVVLGLGLGLEPKSLALAKQILGLARLVICQTNNTVTMLKSTCSA